MKKIEFKSVSEKDLKILIEQSEKKANGKIHGKTFNRIFKFVTNENGEIMFFDSVKDVETFLNEQGIEKDDHYKYVFTAIDGEGSSMSVLNGYHRVNRLGYYISNVSWSCGDKEKDNKLYFEANF